MIDEVKTIRRIAYRPEMILQLAEEANELAVAAYNFSNTKKPPFLYNIYNETRNDFIEEIADVKLSIDIIGDYLEDMESGILLCEENQLFSILIKECCNLSKYAIKLRRTTTPGASPTPMTKEEAEQKLIKAINTVKSCIDSIGDYWDSDEVNKVYKEKAIRCVKRLGY